MNEKEGTAQAGKESASEPQKLLKKRRKGSRKKVTVKRKKRIHYVDGDADIMLGRRF